MIPMKEFRGTYSFWTYWSGPTKHFCIQLPQTYIYSNVRFLKDPLIMDLCSGPTIFLKVTLHRIIAHWLTLLLVPFVSELVNPSTSHNDFFEDSLKIEISPIFKAKTTYERLYLIEQQIRFEIAALFHPPIRWVKKCGKIKSNLFLDQMVSFLYSLCSKDPLRFE